MCVDGDAFADDLFCSYSVSSIGMISPGGEGRRNNHQGAYDDFSLVILLRRDIRQMLMVLVVYTCKSHSGHILSLSPSLSRARLVPIRVA